MPGGQAVTSLVKPAVVALVYPAIVTHSLRHLVLSSTDGRTWSPLKTSDDLLSLTATAQASSFGFFAVGVRGGLPSPQPSGGGGARSPLPWIIIGLAVVIAVALFVTRVGTSSPRGNHAETPTRAMSTRARGRGRHERPSGGRSGDHRRRSK